MRRLNTPIPLLLVLALVAPWLAGCEGDTTEALISVPDVKQANLIMVRLEDSGITHAVLRTAVENRAAVFVIRVPPDRLADARRVLVKYDLPRTTEGGFAQLLSGNRLIPTASEERARLMYATAEELARTFEMWDRIVDARVHFTIPERDEFGMSGEIEEPISALVVLRYIPTEEEVAALDNDPTAPLGDSRPIPDKEVMAMVRAAVSGLPATPAEQSQAAGGTEDTTFAARPGGTGSGGGVAEVDNPDQSDAAVIVQWARVTPVPLTSGDATNQTQALRAHVKDLEVELEKLKTDASDKDGEPEAPTARIFLLATTTSFAMLTVIFGFLFVNERRKRPADSAGDR